MKKSKAWLKILLWIILGIIIVGILLVWILSTFTRTSLNKLTLQEKYAIIHYTDSAMLEWCSVLSEQSNDNKDKLCPICDDPLLRNCEMVDQEDFNEQGDYYLCHVSRTEEGYFVKIRREVEYGPFSKDYEFLDVEFNLNKDLEVVSSELPSLECRDK